MAKDTDRARKSILLLSRAQHVFEFGDFVLEMDKVFDAQGLHPLDGAERDSFDRLMAGEFHAPQPICVLTWAGATGGKPTEYLALIMEMSSHPTIAAVITSVIEHECDTNSWTLIPATVSLERRRLDADYYGTVHFQDCPENTEDACSETMGRVTSLVMCLIGVLAWPGTVVEASKQTKETNRLRRARGLKPLPPINRLVRIDLNRLTRVAPAAAPAGTHASPIPHDRRSHMRRMKSGITVPVRASKIKGGAIGLTLHEVR